jgi:hypothetical protein
MLASLVQMGPNELGELRDKNVTIAVIRVTIQEGVERGHKPSVLPQFPVPLQRERLIEN